MYCFSFFSTQGTKKYSVHLTQKFGAKLLTSPECKKLAKYGKKHALFHKASEVTN